MGLAKPRRGFSETQERVSVVVAVGLWPIGGGSQASWLWVFDQVVVGCVGLRHCGCGSLANLRWISCVVAVGLRPSSGWLSGSFFGLSISHFDFMWVGSFSFFALLLN